MPKDNTNTVVKEYREHRDSYVAFTKKMKNLVNELLKEKNIHVHSVTSRVKTEASLQKKLGKLEEIFSKLSDVPDTAGIRVCTYFTDEVDLVAKIIEDEFDVNEKRSVDKRELLDPDRFGYLSLHYVVKLKTPRLNLTENQRFKNLCAEIQIRSILQHAWAEIEHDLGYKTKHSVPKEIRRRFSRLAGLLEIADDEFVNIRDELSDYEGNVPERIARAPAFVFIDRASLASFIETSPIVQTLDRKIASPTLSKVIPRGKFAVGILTYMLNFNGITSIAELDSSLRTEQEMLLKFAELWFPKILTEIEAGICIISLCYILVGKTKSLPIIRSYLKSLPGLSISEQEAVPIADRVFSVYSKVAGSPS